MQDSLSQEWRARVEGLEGELQEQLEAVQEERCYMEEEARRLQEREQRCREREEQVSVLLRPPLVVVGAVLYVLLRY